MPQSTIELPRLLEMLPRPISHAELAEVLWSSKAELGEVDGDEARVECTADRLDLLSEGGLGLHLQGVLGGAQGLAPLRAAPATLRLSLRVDPSVAPLRPAIAGVVVAPPEGTVLDAGLLAEAVRFQELLHATFGADRRLASLGIYPMARFHGPVRYSLEPLADVLFTPLDTDAPVSGVRFYEEHPMAAQYGSYGRAGDRCLVLRDARGAILSLPPVLNSREAGEARAGDGPLLLESTGTRDARVEEALGLLSLVFVARGWHVAPVAVERPDRTEAGVHLTRPRHVHLPDRVLERLAGRSLPPSEVEEGFRHCRLDPARTADGWTVGVPPWRPDLQTPTDLAEDLLLIRGVRPEDGLLVPSRSRGARTPMARFRAAFADRLLGLAFVPLYTPVLVSERSVRLTGRTEAIALSNPVSEQYAYLRDSLLPSLVTTLERNRRHSYPQRFSEVGPVVVPSPDAETGSETRFHAGALFAGNSAGFADAAALVDYLMRSCGAAGVREPSEIPGTIPGRAAVVRLAGEPVAQLGELHPAVLTETGVPVPVAWAEVDLSALAPLLG